MTLSALMVKITSTLSEASTDFSVEDVTVSGGSLNGFEGSGRYTAIFSPATDITTNGGISVAAGTFTDAVGTANDTGANISIAVDTQAPTVALATSGNGNTLTPGTTETITVTLSEGSEDFDVEDLTPNGGVLENFTANSPTEYGCLRAAGKPKPLVRSLWHGKFLRLSREHRQQCWLSPCGSTRSISSLQRSVSLAINSWASIRRPPSLRALRSIIRLQQTM